jgi:hypothetical protein
VAFRQLEQKGADMTDMMAELDRLRRDNLLMHNVLQGGVNVLESYEALPAPVKLLAAMIKSTLAFIDHPIQLAQEAHQAL